MLLRKPHAGITTAAIAQVPAFARIWMQGDAYQSSNLCSLPMLLMQYLVDPARHVSVHAIGDCGKCIYSTHQQSCSALI